MSESKEEFLERMRSIGSISRRSGDRVREYTRGGERVKEVTDELNNTKTFHKDGQDVTIRPNTITASLF